jgi:sugar/nucleoside kinase (ribokinase family)
MEPIDYLLIGHVSKDLTPDGPRLGGAVTFGALTARALGLRVGVVTSAPDESGTLLEPLRGIPLARVPAEFPTTFVNQYTPHGRQQVLVDRAAPLEHGHVPAAWRSAPMVHLAPVADEVAPSLARDFDGALVGITPQGWMRQWDASGRVSFRPWAGAQDVLPYAQVCIMSIEDVQGDESIPRDLARLVDVLVVTRGPQGGTLFIKRQPCPFSTPRVKEVDPTGAGDIFAVAFMARLRQVGDPQQAARFAAVLASASVEQSGVDSIPTPEAVRLAMAGSLDEGNAGG